MNLISVSVERVEVQQRPQQMYDSGVVNPSMETKKSSVYVYGIDHRAEEAKGKVRNQQAEQEGQQQQRQRGGGVIASIR